MNIKRQLRRIKQGLFEYSYKHKFISYKGKYLKVELKGGLCNKLHCLFSACDIAIKQEAFIIEPEFGWKHKILFSDIYDIKYFNQMMSEYTQGRDLIIPESSVENKSITTNNINLWGYSEKELIAERDSGLISSRSTKLLVLKALKLRDDYESIVLKYISNKYDTAIQVRIESDWQKHAENKVFNDKKESVLVGLEQIIKMLSDTERSRNIFFTTGENHQKIINALAPLYENIDYFYRSDLEYEINAAINFEICSRAKVFIGNSRSSYSNLISLKRAFLLGTDESYIYNYGDKIHRRVDKGLQPAAPLSISKKTIFIDGTEIQE